jgi:hypothetical protein
VQLAVRNDEELYQLFAGVTIASETSAMLVDEMKGPDDLIRDCLNLDEPWVYTRLPKGSSRGHQHEIITGLTKKWPRNLRTSHHLKILRPTGKILMSMMGKANYHSDLDVNDGEGELSFKRRVDMLRVADRKTHAARAKEELEECNRKEHQDREKRKREEERSEHERTEREEGDRKAAVKRKVYADARQSKRKK